MTVTPETVEALIGPPPDSVTLHLSPMQSRIVHALAGREFMNKQLLAAKLGVSQASLRVHISNMRPAILDHGYNIHRSGNDGYMLVRTGATAEGRDLAAQV